MLSDLIAALACQSCESPQSPNGTDCGSCRYCLARAATRAPIIEESKPSEILPLAEDMVRDALTDRGARWLWEEIERYAAEVSPIHRHVTDDEVRVVSQLLSVDSPFEGFDPITELQCRRLLGFVLQEIEDNAASLGDLIDA